MGYYLVIKKNEFESAELKLMNSEPVTSQNEISQKEPTYIHIYIYIYIHTHTHTYTYTYISFSSVAQSCPRLCDPMAYSMPGFPVHYQLPELPQTHVH